MQRLQHKCEPHSTCHIQQFANQPKTQPRANSNARVGGRVSGSAKVSLKLKRKIENCILCSNTKNWCYSKTRNRNRNSKNIYKTRCSPATITWRCVRQFSEAISARPWLDMARNDDRSWERGMQMQCLIDDTLCWCCCCCWWTLSIAGIVRVRKNKRLKAQTRAASECNARTLLINHACVTRECRRATGAVC